MSESNGFLSRQQLLAPKQRRYAVADLPSGGKVRVRAMSEAERSRWEAGLLGRDGQTDPRKLRDSRARLIIATLVDENGELLLTPADIDAVKKMDASDAAAIGNEAARLCSSDEGDFESLAKNFEATADVSSATA